MHAAGDLGRREPATGIRSSRPCPSPTISGSAPETCRSAVAVVQLTIWNQSGEMQPAWGKSPKAGCVASPCPSGCRADHHPSETFGSALAGSITTTRRPDLRAAMASASQDVVSDHSSGIPSGVPGGNAWISGRKSLVEVGRRLPCLCHPWRCVSGKARSPTGCRCRFPPSFASSTA